MNKREKRTLKAAGEILLRKVKEFPKLLWRDRKYVIVKVLAFVFFAWSIVDLFSYNGADQLEAEVRTAQSFISLLLLVTPSSVLFADDFDVHSKRKDGEE